MLDRVEDVDIQASLHRSLHGIQASPHRSLHCIPHRSWSLHATRTRIVLPFSIRTRSPVAPSSCEVQAGRQRWWRRGCNGDSSPFGLWKPRARCGRQQWQQWRNSRQRSSVVIGRVNTRQAWHQW